MTTTETIPSQRTTSPATPAVEPYNIADDAWLIPNWYPAGPGVFLPVNTMVIRGEQPIIVDTGAPIHRQSVLEQVCGLVDPADVRWIYLSHDDGDHTGAVHDFLERCPNATLVVNFFLTERLALEKALPLDRMIWLGPGDVLDAGDRKLHLIVPPIFDGPATRALFDEKTRVLWSVDSFASLTPALGYELGDVPSDMYDETFALLNSLISPWHQWLDATKYAAHAKTLQALGFTATASAHGPVLRGQDIDDAFGRVIAMAGEPIVQPPGQPALEEMLAATTVTLPT